MAHRSIWPKVPSGFVASALSGHSAIALAVGALMYILCLSGALLVFFQDFERWEQPAAPEYRTISPDAVELGARNVLAQVGETPHHFYVGLPTADMPRAVVSTDDESFFIDRTGAVTGAAEAPWTHFLTYLHIYLHLPGVLGLTVVGLLGAMLVGLIISGFLAHPRVFRDAFALRLGGAKRLGEADLHNRLSVWGAPFHLVIALTGAMFGLASVLAYFVAALAYDGDTTAVFEPVFGAEPVADAAPAPLANIAGALSNLDAAHPELIPTYVSMHDPGTSGQTLQINAIHPRRLIYAEIYNFDTDGTLTGNVGLSEGPVGQQLIAASYPAHFGSFGGLPIRLAYGALGLALCVVTATGLNIWLIKRAERGRPAPKLKRAWIGVVWGGPLALAVTGLAAGLGAGEAGLIAIFWIGLAALIAASVAAADARRLSRVLRAATGAALAAILGVHLVRFGGAALSPASFGVTAVIALTAAAFLVSARELLARRRTQAPAPAE